MNNTFYKKKLSQNYINDQDASHVYTNYIVASLIGKNFGRKYYRNHYAKFEVDRSILTACLKPTNQINQISLKKITKVTKGKKLKREGVKVG